MNDKRQKISGYVLKKDISAVFDFTVSLAIGSNF